MEGLVSILDIGHQREPVGGLARYFEEGANSMASCPSESLPVVALDFAARSLMRGSARAKGSSKKRGSTCCGLLLDMKGSHSIHTLLLCAHGSRWLVTPTKVLASGLGTRCSRTPTKRMMTSIIRRARETMPLPRRPTSRRRFAAGCTRRLTQEERMYV